MPLCVLIILGSTWVGPLVLGSFYSLLLPLWQRVGIQVGIRSIDVSLLPDLPGNRLHQAALSWSNQALTAGAASMSASWPNITSPGPKGCIWRYERLWESHIGHNQTKLLKFLTFEGLHPLKPKTFLQCMEGTGSIMALIVILEVGAGGHSKQGQDRISHGNKQLEIHLEKVLSLFQWI